MKGWLPVCVVAGDAGIPERSNPWALHAIVDRLLEAADRGLWESASPETVTALQDVRLKAERFVEERGERVRVRS